MPGAMVQISPSSAAAAAAMLLLRLGAKLFHALYFAPSYCSDAPNNHHTETFPPTAPENKPRQRAF